MTFMLRCRGPAPASAAMTVDHHGLPGQILLHVPPSSMCAALSLAFSRISTVWITFRSR